MTTKTTKVLKSTPPAHLAAPLLNACFQKNAAEMDKIMAIVPRQAVLSPHTGYLGAREFLEGRLLLVALEFWRSTAFAANCNAAVLAHDPKRPAREVFELDAEFQAWKSWGRMLSALLSEMCSHAGLDEPAVREFLSLPPADTETPLTAEEQDQLAERIDEFKTALLEAGRGVQ